MGESRNTSTNPLIRAADFYLLSQSISRKMDPAFEPTGYVIPFL
jgi:hypothetical protein